MELSVEREVLLKPLQQVIGAIERRQTMPALANVLLRCHADGISLTATDLEIEMIAFTNVDVSTEGVTTVPARKLLDICKALPESSSITIKTSKDKVILTSGRSRFTLLTLPHEDFPSIDDIKADISIRISQMQLKSLIEKTAFAMAQQDVRYYLNGLMLEVDSQSIKAVATDGHRLALNEMQGAFDIQAPRQVIVPRKGINELLRLLEDSEDEVEVDFSSNHIRISMSGLRFTSKLVDGRFPDYKRVIPSETDKTIQLGRIQYRQALVRASILSNEKYRGVRLVFESGIQKIQAHNPEQEEAEEEISIDYDGEHLEIGFNVTYLLDVLNTLNEEMVTIRLKDANSSALITALNDESAKYVVMPMRL